MTRVRNLPAYTGTESLAQQRQKLKATHDEATQQTYALRDFENMARGLVGRVDPHSSSRVIYVADSSLTAEDRAYAADQAARIRRQMGEEATR